MSVLYDMDTAERYIPLNNLAEGQARYCVYNSPLSEAAVLGFDYGYSLDYPDMLCIWEAQFGDFMNGAQTIIDQFIVSSESKWQRPSGIVLLLPHGYEGQGPEHSSGRVERFLQSCAEDNIQVCNLTTPAQYFHVLRRQMMRPFLKPLVIMTPKSLLRSEAAVSFNDDFTKARFSEVLETPAPAGAAKAKRVILCTGKVYYDLLKARDTNKADDTALVRIEQLYPLDTEMLKTVLAPYAKAQSWGVVPGGIAEHGRVEFHRAAAGGSAPGGQEARLRGPQRQRQPGSRREDPPRPRAEAARGRSVRGLSGEREQVSSSTTFCGSGFVRVRLCVAGPGHPAGVQDISRGFPTPGTRRRPKRTPAGVREARMSVEIMLVVFQARAAQEGDVFFPERAGAMGFGLVIDASTDRFRSDALTLNAP